MGRLSPWAEPTPTWGLRFTTVSDRVTVAIYDIQGRKVVKVHDMDMPPSIYNALWDGTDSDSLRVASGTYFARASNSFASDTRKITLPQNGAPLPFSISSCTPRPARNSGA